MKIWHIDSSSRTSNSNGRSLSKLLVDKIKAKAKKEVIYRDVGRGEGLSYIDENIASALFISDDQRSDIQKQGLRPSDVIIDEAIDSDVWVLSIPIYNFSMPATFKMWADMLARLNVTFKYTENGPEGLLLNKKVFAIITSGGTQIDSDIDFLTPWLKHYLGFIGINDVSIINAEKYSADKEELVVKQIDKAVSAL